MDAQTTLIGFNTLVLLAGIGLSARAALDATPLLSWSVIAPLIGAGLVSGIVIAATSLNALAGLLLPFVIAAVVLGVTLRQAPQRVAPS